MSRDDYPSFGWLSEPDDDGNETYVSIYPAMHGRWEVTIDAGEDVFDTFLDDDFDTFLDDDAASAWSTVAYIMAEHGATPEETDAMVAAAPASLGWCFDGQVGMYAYDKNEEWDG